MRKSSCRDKIEIVADILKKAKDGTCKTHIMYSCNLSFEQNKKYLRVLSGLGFLVVGSDGQYKITPEGIDASRKIEEIRRTFSGLYERLRER